MTFARASSLIALTVVGILFAWAWLNDPSDDQGRTARTAEPAPRAAAAVDLPVLRPAPDLVELEGWLQTDATALEDYRGKVVVLQFDLHRHDEAKAALERLQEIKRSNPEVPDISRLEKQVVGG